MKNKTKFKLANYFAVLFIIFWQVETWFFIIRDGWHLHAVTEAEKICDNISGWLLTIAVFFIFSILYDVAKMFAYANITSITINKEKED